MYVPGACPFEHVLLHGVDTTDVPPGQPQLCTGVGDAVMPVVPVELATAV